ncbi:Beta-phosphoglucomutase [Gemmata obscuriglobus]|uniref:HAD family phosphatase n=1 Tax=Gemmata obscuriglobus TaxID=114 RepID=A0A2Z3H253_9BACT|nr:HAD family phosphatase [Gemmata obscuriglobus]AWM37646.1 HAD family phosphatase [Gemmata obscuriglobus]QEG29557.1 Beta-phosphoglucomutase [Gemmata obscuriglobus]VTS08793.1 had-superfamily hydrolase : HAD-superfamily hydrolase, subfamily IA, variant 3 OS=Chthoniobacter flavus Ellin428 GN=CfE428DRAFT_0735 PE=4 SV=1: HAD_2 [Gemmata obscuriglobus UQM 2246]
MTIPAIIWDVDGTLVDTAEHHFQAWARFAAEIGRPFTRADFAATFGMRNLEILRKLFEPDADDALCAKWGEQKENHYRASVRKEGTQLLPGVARLLKEFADRGWPQAVGSSAPQGNIDLLLSVTNTRGYFGAVVTGDDVKRGKPDPEVFLTAAAQLGADPRRCVVFEDAAAGVEAAQAGGMKCVAVTFVGHHPADKLRAAGADIVVGSLDEITAEQVAALV